MHKKSQITLFIIIGIVILIAAALVIYLAQQEKIFKPKPSPIPLEVSPIKDYIEACIFKLGTEAADRIGATGGFITYPQEIRLDPASYIKNAPAGIPLMVPMWRYNGQERIPSEDYMKEDINSYINTNLLTCLENLEPFRAQYDIKELGPVVAQTIFREESVQINVDYPISIADKQGRKIAELREFTASVPYRLKEAYELARKIMREENLDMFVEDTILDLIAMDPDIPYSDFEFRCDPKVWYVRDVKEKIQTLLAVNLPEIRIDRTAYEPIAKERVYEQSHYIWPVTDLKYPSTRVSLTYDAKWPMHLYIRPNDGEVLRSNAQRGQDLLSYLCMHFWHFTYDMKFPVLVTITDEATSKHAKYTFTFAFQAAIDHNRPDATNKGTMVFDFTPAATSERFCAEMTQYPIAINTIEAIETDLYGNLTEDISGVNITYTCLRYTCNAGQSRFTSGGVALLETSLPYCLNGILRGNKEGYEKAEMWFDSTAANADKTIPLYLTPIAYKNYVVVKHPVSAPSKEEDLGAKETATITIRRKNATFESFGVYPSTEPMPLKFLDKWTFAYELELWLMDEDKGIIGGYKADWTVPKDELAGADRIKFHVIEMPYTTDEMKMAERIISIPSESSRLKSYLEPEFE